MYLLAKNELKARQYNIKVEIYKNLRYFPGQKTALNYKQNILR